MPSTDCEISLAERLRVPLKSMCSMKCETPFNSFGSKRPPTPTHNPRLTLAMCGISAVATVRPFGRRVTRYIVRGDVYRQKQAEKHLKSSSVARQNGPGGLKRRQERESE